MFKKKGFGAVFLTVALGISGCLFSAFSQYATAKGFSASVIDPVVFFDQEAVTQQSKVPPQGKIVEKTFTYKQVGELAIKADVYQIDDGIIRPVVVWIHGGALITGSRRPVGQWFRQDLVNAGYHLVSIDYRLAPETKLPQIIEDLEDAFAWIRKEGPKLFNADPERIAAIGGSAGGYLALTAGYRVKPRPRMIASMWGFGDLVGPWVTEPNAIYNSANMTEEEAIKIAQGPPIANDKDRKGNGWGFYMYCKKNGVFLDFAGGWPRTEKEKYYPYMPLKNVSSEYPPTLLIHGTADTDVPYEQAKLMEQEFVKFNVPYKLFTGKGAGHGFMNADPKDYARAPELVLEFVNKYLKN